MAVLKLIAVCKDSIWGGNRLRTEFGKTHDADNIAESWELCCCRDGENIIDGGEFDGKTLSEFIEHKRKNAVLGTDCVRFERFPILIKLIDANDDLSVQVHPSNDYALKVEGEYGKAELWYVVDCVPGAELIYGLKRELSKEELVERINNGTLLDAVNRVSVKRGDVLFIESGTFHAICKGILIAEIQQNSNVTYRVYDYGRVGKDGKQRELHIKKALDVAVCTPSNYPAVTHGVSETVEGGMRTLLYSGEYFTVSKLTVNGIMEISTDGRSFLSLLFLDGSAIISDFGEAQPAKKGDSFFIPAYTGILSINGNCEVLMSSC